MATYGNYSQKRPGCLLTGLYVCFCFFSLLQMRIAENSCKHAEFQFQPTFIRDCSARSISVDYMLFTFKKSMCGEMRKQQLSYILFTRRKNIHILMEKSWVMQYEKPKKKKYPDLLFWHYHVLFPAYNLHSSPSSDHLTTLQLSFLAPDQLKDTNTNFITKEILKVILKFLSV